MNKHEWKALWHRVRADHGLDAMLNGPYGRDAAAMSSHEEGGVNFHIAAWGEVGTFFPARRSVHLRRAQVYMSDHPGDQTAHLLNNGFRNRASRRRALVHLRSLGPVPLPGVEVVPRWDWRQAA